MYLANLSEKDRMLFQDWTSSLFEFSIDVIKHEGHIELQIKMVSTLQEILWTQDLDIHSYCRFLR